MGIHAIVVNPNKLLLLFCPESCIIRTESGCSAAGSAPALGAGCRKFESCHSDHKSPKPLIQSVSDFSFFSIEKALENKGFWQQGVQIDLLAARIFCFPGKIIYFYDFQMNPLVRNNLIVREKI